MRLAGIRVLLTLFVSLQIFSLLQGQEIDRTILNSETWLQDDFVYSMHFDKLGCCGVELLQDYLATTGAK